MTGATFNHAVIQGNLIAALTVRLRGGPCRVIGSEVASRIRHPDAFV